jgi:hypothetical protein
MKKIKHFTVLLYMTVFALFSCNSKEKIMSEEDFRAKVDSLTEIRIREVERQAHELLDHRIAIEVKVKADSIVLTQKQKK